MPHHLRSGDGRAHERSGACHGLDELRAQRQLRGDSRRECAAGAVNRVAGDPLAGEPIELHAIPLRILTREQVVGVGFAVAALDENGASSELHHHAAGRILERSSPRRLLAHQAFELGEVGGHERGAGEELAQRRPGPLLEEHCARARPEHGIDDQRSVRRQIVQRQQHGPGHVVGRQHADLDGRDLEIPQQHAELVEHDRGEERQDPMHRAGVLDGERRQDAGTVDTQGVEDLQIELKTGAAGGIGACDAERHGHRAGW